VDGLLLAQIGVLAEIFQWKGDAAPSLADWSAVERQAVGHELSGVLLYLIRMADVCGVDLGSAALDKLAKQDAL
jgi:dCTP diphosphatase